MSRVPVHRTNGYSLLQYARSGLVLCCLVLAGCARGEWPSLSDRLPDPQDRVLVRAEPSSPSTVKPANTPNESLDEAEVMALLRTVRAEVKQLQAEYFEAAAGYDLAAIPPQAGSRQELRHMWMNLQLLLTRVSQSASRLNDILYAGNELDAGLVQEARELKSSVEDLVATESEKRVAPRAG